MNVIQKWLMGLIAISALYVVSAPDSHFARAAGAATDFIARTDKTAMGRA